MIDHELMCSCQAASAIAITSAKLSQTSSQTTDTINIVHCLLVKFAHVTIGLAKMLIV